MPRRHRNRTMKGGFLGDLSNTLSGWWEKTKQATTDATTSLTGSTSSTSSYTPALSQASTAPMTTPTFGSTTGGKHRRSKRRRILGGFKDNTPITGLAAHAGPFSGPTAQPHNLVGGRTRRRGRKGGFIGEIINQAIVPVSILAMQQNYRRKKGGRTHRQRRH